jgi:glycosyltransferase involved in cell wall biosynthesis
MKKPFVSIVICTQNRAESLDKLALDSITRSNYSNFEVIIVNDASTDDTIKVFEKYKNKIKKIKIINNKNSKGLCYARNLGVRYCEGEIIAFTDDDCIVDKNWLNELAKSYTKDPKLMVLGGLIYINNSKKILNKYNKILGGNMSFRNKVFDKFLFDPWMYFNKCSYEDETELISRIRKSGYIMSFNKNAIVYHFRKPASYRKNVSIGYPLNRLYIYSKEASIVNYYFSIFDVLIKRIFSNKGNIKFKNLEYDLGCIMQVVKKEKLQNKLPYIIYSLLFEIPLKSLIRNMQNKYKNLKNLRKILI